MKALVLQSIGSYPIIQDIDTPTLSDENQALVQVSHCGLNRRDFYITQGLYPGIELPAVLGSDVCGFYEGKPVVVNPNINWGDNEAFQSPNYTILGMPSKGGLAELVKVGKDRIYPKPEHLSMEEASILPLGGLTAFRALFTKGQFAKGQKVFINGIGGGVASLAFSMAKAISQEVYVSSGSDEKIQAAIKLGAKGGVNYKKENWHKELQAMSGGVDVIIDSAGGDGFAYFPRFCRPGARIVSYGGTRGKINGLSPQHLNWKQISILTSTMGSDREFEQMLHYVNEHEVRPILDTVYTMETLSSGLDRLKNSSQLGKISIKID